MKNQDHIVGRCKIIINGCSQHMSRINCFKIPAKELLDSGLVNIDEQNEVHTEGEKGTEEADGEDKKGEESVKNGGSVEKKKSAKGGIVHIRHPHFGSPL